ncbi:MAG: AEC family transporter [Candidatus Nomurabacteria bacterium]|jgi:predicted permease|nr:AEC family transporter [Candidatus Nomurabacteria bacterium]
MVDLGSFYQGIGVVVVLILLGFFLSKIKVLNDVAVKAITNLLLSVALPIAFMRSFPASFSVDAGRMFVWGIGAAALLFAILIPLAQVFFRGKSDNYEYKFAFLFNNTSFIGYPLVSAAFGLEGMTVYAGFMLVWTLVVFTYGVKLFNRKFGFRDVIKSLVNPNVIGIVAGATMFLCSFQMPAFGNKLFGTIAGVTTPLSLLCVGFMLSEARLVTIFKRWRVVIVCILQLIVPPVLTYFVLKLIGAPLVVIQVAVLMEALPTAALLGLFTKKYRGGKHLASEAGEIVALSTILSLVTVPILVNLLVI